jgi:hypothetical protein
MPTKVTIDQYVVLDTNRIEQRKARRWGTRDAIDRLRNAEIMENSATLVDTSELNPGSFTALDFDPKCS